MRDYAQEKQRRVAFLRHALEESGAKGFVFGNSGGKDSALCGILCKAACERTVGIVLPCASKQNFGSDMQDGLKVAEAFGIETRTVDLTPVRSTLTAALGGEDTLAADALNNIAPRLRMTALYTVAANEKLLVVGTGNRCEAFLGYFTKWGDGAYDVNPIADLMVSEVYDFLRFLGAPQSIIDKAPSAGLYEGQTDEKEMGVSYAEVERYLKGQQTDARAREIIARYHARSEHKRRMPLCYSGDELL